ncbi:MAG: ATP-dependent helicase [Methanomicrobiales archaeon]|nr:ATP-dependent helicase [Methanomicrobiales archaeon]
MTTREFQVFGPPGTGKTTYLTKQIGLAAEKYGIENIMVASFTRTAAHELVGRNREASDSIGTLHSHCYRAIGKRDIAETKITEFNKDFPQFRLSEASGSVSIEDAAAESGPTAKTVGDDLYHRMNMNRARMIPMNLWPQNVLSFRNSWTTWKKLNHMVDFTDMIEIAYQDFPSAPGNPTIGFFDEAQDFTPLELALIRKWGESMDYIVIAGDDDQLLYSWLGATPEAFFGVEPENKRILSQSHRVPAAVHRYAEQWIRKIKNRQEKDYKPRDFEGEIRRFNNGNYKLPDEIIRDAEKYIEAGKTVMFLASCSYMLNPLIYRLKEEGILFHNPYRVKQGAWNPLRVSEGSTASRVAAFMKGPLDFNPRDTWSPEDFLKWTEIIKATGNFPRGTKDQLPQIIEEMFSINCITLEDIFLDESTIWQLFDEFTTDNAAKWWLENVQSSKIKASEYPLRLILKNNNIEILQEKPQVIVGTIHSVKGGEADVVYLFPDLSVAGMQGYVKSTEERDSTIRMLYVGMTRAKETLVLCQGASNYAVRWI